LNKQAGSTAFYEGDNMSKLCKTCKNCIQIREHGYLCDITDEAMNENDFVMACTGYDEALSSSYQSNIQQRPRKIIGKTVRYRDKIYEVTQWIHYRLEWFEVELKDHEGYHKFWLKESDVVVL